MAIIVRRRFITNKDGEEIEITSNAVLKEILSQMTPEELEEYKNQYRFCYVDMDLPNFPSYGGRLRDVL